MEFNALTRYFSLQSWNGVGLKWIKYKLILIKFMLVFSSTLNQAERWILKTFIQKLVFSINLKAMPLQNPPPDGHDGIDENTPSHQSSI